MLPKITGWDRISQQLQPPENKDKHQTTSEMEKDWITTVVSHIVLQNHDLYENLSRNEFKRDETG